eukprot:357193-Chlamydomonas_euryale.AAC.2
MLLNSHTHLCHTVPSCLHHTHNASTPPSPLSSPDTDTRKLHAWHCHTSSASLRGVARAGVACTDVPRPGVPRIGVWRSGVSPSAPRRAGVPQPPRVRLGVAVGDAKPRIGEPPTPPPPLPTLPPCFGVTALPTHAPPPRRRGVPSPSALCRSCFGCGGCSGCPASTGSAPADRCLAPAGSFLAAVPAARPGRGCAAALADDARLPGSFPGPTPDGGRLSRPIACSGRCLFTPDLHKRQRCAAGVCGGGAGQRRRLLLKSEKGGRHAGRVCGVWRGCTALRKLATCGMEKWKSMKGGEDNLKR